MGFLLSLLARCWSHDGEDETAVKASSGETDADNNDGPLFIPAEHFHGQ